MVGTLEPRKNHQLILDVFDQLLLDKQDINLVIVGKAGWLIDELVDEITEHSEFGQRLFWLDSISDEFLDKIYAACSCLVAASEGEGFGLPLIEASQHQLPIIARDISVFREVAGEFATYFSGLDDAALALCINDWLELHSQGKILDSENMPRLTWRESTEVLLATMGLELSS